MGCPYPVAVVSAEGAAEEVSLTSLSPEWCIADRETRYIFAGREVRQLCAFVFTVIRTVGIIRHQT